MQQEVINLIQYVAGDVVLMGTSSDKPTHVLLWSIDIGANAHGEIDIFYKGAAEYTLSGGETIEDYLMRVVDKNEPKRWSRVKENHPYRTPLSIEHLGKSYMVFVLQDKNWQFMDEDAPPFMVERGKENFYTNAICTWRDEGGTMHWEPFLPKGQRCVVASFMADSAADQAASGGSGVSFNSRFNFLLTLKLRRNGQTLRSLPVIIDPDVGHPGGHLLDP